jgi:3-oxoacyl-[acyl-carrier protein] reductase
VRTPMLDSLNGFDEAERSAATPLGRIGEPADVVGPVLFLLGPGSAFITGQVLSVDGGLTLR